MPSLIVTERAPPNFRYGVKKYKVGAVFEASERDARLLVEIGHATYQIEDVVQEPKQKRRYRRSDMRAEE